MIRTVVLIVAMLSVGFTASLGQVAAPSEDQWKDPVAGEEWLSPDLIQAISEDTVLAVLEQERDRLKGLPLYLKVSYARHLLQALTTIETCETAKYAHPVSHHDLDCVAGRAAWMLEETFEISVPTIKASSSRRVRQEAHDEAKLQIDAFNRGVRTIIDRYRIGRDKRGLRRRYQRLILEGTQPEDRAKFAFAAVAPMNEMLEKWFPLGKRFADLESIVGRKAWTFDRISRDQESSRDVTGVFEYVCESESRATAYYFLVRGGVIEAVNVKQ